MRLRSGPLPSSGYVLSIPCGSLSNAKMIRCADKQNSKMLRHRGMRDNQPPFLMAYGILSSPIPKNKLTCRQAARLVKERAEAGLPHWHHSVSKTHRIEACLLYTRFKNSAVSDDTCVWFAFTAAHAKCLVNTRSGSRQTTRKSI